MHTAIVIGAGLALLAACLLVVFAVPALVALFLVWRFR